MTVRIFVNERAVTVPDGSDVLAAIQLFDAALCEAVRTGSAFVTDGVGRAVKPTADVATGDILRVIVSARRGADDTSA